MWPALALTVAAGLVLLVLPVKEGVGPPAGSFTRPTSPDYGQFRGDPLNAGARGVLDQYKWYFDQPASQYNWTSTISDGLYQAAFRQW